MATLIENVIDIARTPEMSGLPISGCRASGWWQRPE